MILASMLRILFGLTLAVCAFAQYRRGVDISGAEFGNKSIPGTLGRDYTFESESTFQYFGENRGKTGTDG
jgi:hypothetical protein